MKHFACHNRSGTNAPLQVLRAALLWVPLNWPKACCVPTAIATFPSRSHTAALRAVVWHPVLVLLLALALTGCKSSPNAEVDIPLPGFGNDGPAKPKGVYAIIRRADVPLDESTDEAWSIINEQVVPPVTRGAWRGNGLRIGLLPRAQLDRYSEAMPQPVAFSRVLMNRSTYNVPIIETSRLRGDLRFQADLTRPPRPRQVENIQGGDNSTLRLLARIETQADGTHTLVLTPQHYIPSSLTLIPRDILDREMDGRVFDELTLRVTPGKDQIAVVGLHWPWPIGEVIEEDEPGNATDADRVSLQTSTRIFATDPGDPAAPPAHLRDLGDALDGGAGDKPGDTAADETDKPIEQDPKPRYERIAPPLATSFGSTLLTGTSIRQPIRTVLLITIEEPQEEQAPALPAE